MGFHPLVDHNRRFILFWNAKCGCSSLKDMFLRVVRSADYSGFDGDVHALHRQVGYQHGPFTCTRASVADELSSYFKWIVVRNPWRRLASFFTDKSIFGGATEVDRAKQIDSRGLTFRELVRVMAPLKSRELQHHLEPQNLGLEDVEFDKVVRLEQTSPAISEIGGQLGLPDLELRQINVARNRVTAVGSEFLGDRPASSFADGPTPSWKQLYDDELIEAAARIYADDIERFGYRFE